MIDTSIRINFATTKRNQVREINVSRTFPDIFSTFDNDYLMRYRRKEKLFFSLGLIQRMRTHGAWLRSSYTRSWKTKMHANTKNTSHNESTVEKAGYYITKLF